MKARPTLLLKTSLPTLEFTVYQVYKEISKFPLDYIHNTIWMSKQKAVVKGVKEILIDEELMSKCQRSWTSLEPRLAHHFAERERELTNHVTITGQCTSHVTISLIWQHQFFLLDTLCIASNVITLLSACS